MISNRMLTVLGFLALLAVIGGNYVMLKHNLVPTAFVSSQDTGTASLFIDSAGGIRFAINTVSFGTGKVNTTAGNTYCILDTNGTNDSLQCINFTANTAGFQLENDGTQNATVQLYFEKNASQFLGGDPTVAKFRYVIANNESGSCTNTTGGYGCIAGENCTVSPIGWTDVNYTTPGTTICPKLLFSDLNDSLLLDINITIPYDAPAGVKSSTVTATATTAP